MATSGMNMLPAPMDRRNGTGRISSDSSPIATVKAAEQDGAARGRARGEDGVGVRLPGLALFPPAGDEAGSDSAAPAGQKFPAPGLRHVHRNTRTVRPG